MKIKNIFIAGAITLTIAGGVYYTVGLYIKKSDKLHTDSVDAILADYKNLSEEIAGEEFKKNLISLCKNKEQFNKKIEEIENRLSELKDRKIEYLLQADKEQKEIKEKEEEEIKRKIQEKLERQKENMGAACPIDYDGQIALPGSWPTNTEGKAIPPSHWPFDLDGNKIPPPGWPLDSNGNPLPPGVCARDYNGELMLDGSWQFDLDGILVPPAHWPKDTDGKPIPPPDWPLDENGDPLPPGSLEQPSSYMENNYGVDLIDTSDDDYLDTDITSPEDVIEKNLQEMSFWENQIKISLDSLRSICNEQQNQEANKAIKKKFSSDCGSACKNFSQCSIVGGGTAEDQADDYKICMEECLTWAEEVRSCINEKAAEGINRTSCSFMSLCIGQEEKYNKGINPLKQMDQNIEDLLNSIK